MLLKHIIKGASSLPSAEKMRESFETEMASCREGRKRYLYHYYYPPHGFRTYDELYGLMPEGAVKEKAEKFMSKYFAVLGQMIELFFKGDFRSF